MNSVTKKAAEEIKTRVIPKGPIAVPQAKILEVLRDSVINGPEGGKKASRFPTIHSYLEMEGEDIPNETVRKLREEFVQIRASLGTMSLGIIEDGQFVLVDKISGRAFASNPDAGIFLRNVGLPRDFPASERIAELVSSSIEMCDEAIRRNCGFGKYTTSG
ncbi:MAG: hypothetical protein KGH94_02800 [Candidatus Micrarchaeota archaeon]|nr:hypothetical protein [Candidatus Micrarchaeota archaeon]